MKFRLWPRRESIDPRADEYSPVEVPVSEARPEPPAPPPPAPAPAAPSAPAPPPAPSSSPVEETAPDQAPAVVSLSIDEAKAAIREAGGDVIQVGFLASAYRRTAEDDPHSAETAAARKRLRELVAKRLKDRGLLASDGTLELREDGPTEC
jgi:hypothetical protein